MTPTGQTTDQDSTYDQIINLVKSFSEEKKKQLLMLLFEWAQEDNKRVSKRVPCLIPVDFSVQDKMMTEFIQNVSAAGVFIETRESLSIGEKIAMTFDVAGVNHHFKLSGKIVRKDAEGIAVKFKKKLSQYQEDMIKEAIEKK